jgi:hypothetical protein
MLTVFWSPLGFSLVEILSKRIRFDSEYFCSNILSAIVQNQPSETPEDRRQRMVMHFDSATAHRAKCTNDYPRANRLTRVQHPAFSPDLAPSDLAPSDFYRFGKHVTDSRAQCWVALSVWNTSCQDEFTKSNGIPSTILGMMLRQK